MSTEQEAPKPEETVEPKTCPRCGWDCQAVKEPEPSEEDRKEYLRCLLSKRLFVKSYPLFQGEFVLKYTALTQEQAEHMGRLLGNLSKDDLMRLTTDAYKLKLLFYLSTIHDKKFEALPANMSDDLWREEYAKRFAGYGEDVIVMLIRVLFEFTKLLEKLPQAGLDANFWKGAGLS